MVGAVCLLLIVRGGMNEGCQRTGDGIDVAQCLGGERFGCEWPFHCPPFPFHEKSPHIGHGRHRPDAAVRAGAWVSLSTRQTITPERNVSAATTPIDQRKPSLSAMIPARSAPIA